MHNPMPEHHEEAPTERLDRLLHAAAVALTGGLSPVSLSLGLGRLGLAPRRVARAPDGTRRAGPCSSASDTLRGADDQPAGAADDDPRFRHPAWAAWPFNLLRAGFRNAETFWREAASVPGMTRAPRRR